MDDKLIFKVCGTELWTWHFEGVPAYQIRFFDGFGDMRRETFRQNLSIAEATMLARAIQLGERP